jgi:hypothetical protein
MLTPALRPTLSLGRHPPELLRSWRAAQRAEHSAVALQQAL